MIKSFLLRLVSRRNVNTAQQLVIEPQPIKISLKRTEQGYILVESRRDVKEHPEYPRKKLGFITLITDIYATEGYSPYAALLYCCRLERLYHAQEIGITISTIEKHGFGVMK